MTARPLEEVRANVLRRVHGLPADDLRVLERVLEELPHAQLVASCEAVTDEGVEGDKPIKVPATSLRVRARARLLRTWDTWRLVAGLEPRPLRGVEVVLRAARAREVSAALDRRGKGT